MNRDVCEHFNPVDLPCAKCAEKVKDESEGMKAYIVDWHSAGNVDEGTVVVAANTISEAQDKFLEWLKERPVYQHMWSLKFSIKECELV